MTDNGNGFNTENYTSFLEAYSQLKVKKGCKGIGRFLLLKAFDSQVRQALISGTLAPGGRNDGSQPPDRRLPEAGMEGSAFAEIACPAGYQGHTVDLPEHDFNFIGTGFQKYLTFFCIHCNLPFRISQTVDI